MFILLLILQTYCIQVQVNTLRPKSNPSEKYLYYTLNFCKPTDLIEKPQPLGQSLSADKRMNSPYEFNYTENHSKLSKLKTCDQNMTQEQVSSFEKAFAEEYIAEYYIDDCSFHDRIGKIENGVYKIKTHVEFNIYFIEEKGKKKFVYANITDSDTDYSNLTEMVSFFYSVNFINSTNDELQKCGTDESDLNISYYSNIIIAKGVIIIILGVVVCILLRRSLRQDFVRFDDEYGFDQVGWKQVKQEALLPPKNRIIFSVLLGNGIHLIATLFVLLVLGIFDIYEIHSGSMKSTGVIIYSFFGYLNGYHSGRFYKYFCGKSWMLNIFIASALFPVSLGSVTFIINIFAWVLGNATIDLASFFSVGFILSVVYLPLTILGGVAGRLRTIDSLPEKRRAKQIIQPFRYRFYYGFIPFLCMLVEVICLTNSTWGDYHFHQYFLLIFSLIQLVLIVGCISIIQTYRQLSILDYKWQWSSFINGGSSGLYVFIYFVQYFYWTNMHGFIQLITYFAYSSLVSLAIWDILGTISYLASLRFVIFIYLSKQQ